MIGLLVLGIYVGFNYYLVDIVSALSGRFASQQVSYDRGRTLQPLLQEIALARKLARSRVVVDWALDEADADKRRRGLGELESARKVFRDRSYFFAIRKSGHYYFNDAKNFYAGKQLRYTLSPEKEDDAWYYATLENEQECQLNVNNDTELKVTKIWINCLVRDGVTNVGVVGTGLELTNFVTSVLDSRQDGVVNMFVDGSGAIQTHPDISRIDFHTLTNEPDARKTVYRMLSDDDDREKLKKMLDRIKSEPDRIETINVEIDGEVKLIGAAYLQGIDWFNITVITPEIWALGQSFVPLIALTLSGVFIIIVFGAVTLHYFVLSRVRRLDAAVQQIKQNDFHLDLEEDTPDEIGRLAEGLKEMAGAVQQDRQVLETEISKRTEDLIAARDQAQNADRAKSEFLASMSHELRTPLNAIIGFSDMMVSETFGKHTVDKYREYSSDILRSSRHLLSIINEILDLSKVEAGEIVINPTKFSLKHALDECVKLVRFNKDANEERINIRLHDDTVSLTADVRIFRQVIINLLSNANKYTPTDGEISIVSETADDGSVLIKVVDTGIGIAPDDIARVLEPFGQSRANVEVTHEGTGLGLSLAKKLMELQGARWRLRACSMKGPQSF